jgi:hypothetical protein
MKMPYVQHYPEEKTCGPKIRGPKIVRDWKTGQFRKAFCECNDSWAVARDRVEDYFSDDLRCGFGPCPICRYAYWVYDDKSLEPF